jgi:transaldolase
MNVPLQNYEGEDDDPIVAEVRRVREQILSEYGYDSHAYAEDVRRRTEEAAKAGRKVVTLPPRRPEGWQNPAASEPEKRAG